MYESIEIASKKAMQRLSDFRRNTSRRSDWKNIEQESALKGQHQQRTVKTQSNTTKELTKLLQLIMEKKLFQKVGKLM